VESGGKKEIGVMGGESRMPTYQRKKAFAFLTNRSVSFDPKFVKKLQNAIAKIPSILFMQK
jgi:hypothetical protein